MLSNGQALWAHCSTQLHHIVRQHPFARASLQDEDVSIDFAEHTSPRDRVAVVVTEPLTKDETWSAFAPGEIRTFVDGAPSGADGVRVADGACCAGAAASGQNRRP